MASQILPHLAAARRARSVLIKWVKTRDEELTGEARALLADVEIHPLEVP